MELFKFISTLQKTGMSPSSFQIKGSTIPEAQQPTISQVDLERSMGSFGEEIAVNAVLPAGFPVLGAIDFGSRVLAAASAQTLSRRAERIITNDVLSAQKSPLYGSGVQEGYLACLLDLPVNTPVIPVHVHYCMVTDKTGRLSISDAGLSGWVLATDTMYTGRLRFSRPASQIPINVADALDIRLSVSRSIRVLPSIQPILFAEYGNLVAVLEGSSTEYMGPAIRTDVCIDHVKTTNGNVLTVPAINGATPILCTSSITSDNEIVSVFSRSKCDQILLYADQDSDPVVVEATILTSPPKLGRFKVVLPMYNQLYAGGSLAAHLAEILKSPIATLESAHEWVEAVGNPAAQPRSEQLATYAYANLNEEYDPTKNYDSTSATSIQVEVNTPDYTNALHQVSMKLGNIDQRLVEMTVDNNTLVGRLEAKIEGVSKSVDKAAGYDKGIQDTLASALGYFSWAFTNQKTRKSAFKVAHTLEYTLSAITAY